MYVAYLLQTTIIDQHKCIRFACEWQVTDEQSSSHPFSKCAAQWAIPFNKGTPLPLWMTELFAYPGTKNFALTPLGQTVVYGELWKFY